MRNLAIVLLLWFGSLIDPVSGQVPSHDTCSDAEVVNLSALPVEITGSNIGARDDETPGCASVSGGKDVFFTFTLASPLDLTISTVDSSFDTLISLREGGCQSPREIDCNDDFDGIFARLDLQQLPAGTYTLLLEGFDSSQEGQYTLSFSTPSVPANNACDQAEAITTGKRIGSTLGASDSPDMRIPGLPSEGPDLFYRFTATAPEMRVDTLGSDIDTTLAVYTGCGGTLLGSSGDFGGETDSLIQLSGLTIGNEYLIQVDSPGGVAGPFSLQLLEAEAPPENDSCADSMASLTLPTTVTGSTEFANHLTGPIEGAPGPEVSYRVGVAEGGNLVVETVGSSFDTVVYVRRGSCNGVQVGYNDNFLGQSASRLVLENLSAADYFIFVDSKSTSERGDFQLSVSGTLAPTNDSCESASLLTIPSTLTGSTAFASDSGNVDEGDCLSLGPDVVYRFTLDFPRKVTFSTVGSEFDTVLYLTQGECGAETVVACNDDFEGFAAAITDFEETPLPAGSYHLYLDGFDESGNFVLESQFLDNPSPTPTATPTATSEATETTTPTPTPTQDGGGPTQSPTPTETQDGSGTRTPTPTFLSPDVNQDESTDSLDLLILVTQRRSGPGNPEQSADFDGSGEVDYFDLFFFSQSWNVSGGKRSR